jgi:hypothetical protein
MKSHVKTERTTSQLNPDFTHIKRGARYTVTVPLFYWILLPLFACTSGKSNDHDTSNDTDTSDTGSPFIEEDEDTAEPTDTGENIDTGVDTGSSTDTDEPDTEPHPDGPIILSVDAQWDEYPDFGSVIEVTIHYSDPDVDMDGGRVLGHAAFSSDVHELDLHIDGIHVLHNPVAEELFFAIIADRDDPTTLLLWLRDQAGHISEASINTVE